MKPLFKLIGSFLRRPGAALALSFILPLFFLDVGLYLYDGLQQLDPQDLPHFRTRAERALDAIEDEVSELGPDHDWAGHYYAGDGLGYNESISLAPKSGYIHTLGGDCGPWSSDETGRLGFTVEGPKARGSKRPELEDPLVPVHWRRRHYLIRKRELIAFANAVNSGDEPRHDSHGEFLLRLGDEQIPVTGRPGLPSKALSLLRKTPLDAEIVSVGAEAYERMELTSDSVITTTDTVVMLNVGRDQGAMKGLVLYPRGSHNGKATIFRVGKERSAAVFQRRFDGNDSPQKGWLLSTRYEWLRSPRPPAFTTTVLLVDKTRRGPYAGEAAHWTDPGRLAEAKRLGFSVERVAKIDLTFAKAEGTRDFRDLDRDPEKIAAGLGANVLLGPEVWSAGSGRTTLVERAYRISWDGVLPNLNFFFIRDKNPTEKDWREAAREAVRGELQAKRDALPYEKARQRVWDAAWARLMGVPEKDWPNFDKMRIEYLSPATRAALRRYEGITALYGTVSEARGSLPSGTIFGEGWENARARLTAMTAAQMAILKLSDSAGAAESERLHKEILKLY